MDKSVYEKMTVNELKEHLRKSGNKVSGRKSELIERLIKLGIPPPEKYIIPRYEILPGFEIYKKKFSSWKGNTCNLKFFPEFFDEKTSFSLYQHILDHLLVPSHTMRRFNRTYGNEGLVYRIRFKEKLVERKALPWSTIPFLQKLRDNVEKITSSNFTYCVVQYYPTGRVGIKPHRDKEMIPGSVIAGLSLGQTRTLRMSRHSQNIDVDLFPGSLYVFYPPMNDYWSHSILTDDSTHPRLSLTFRTLI